MLVTTTADPMPAPLPAIDLAPMRQVLEAKLAAATRTLVVLRGETEIADRDVASARARVEEEIRQILIRRAEELAQKVETAERLARDLRRQLEGLGRTWVGAPGTRRPELLKLGQAAVRVLTSLALSDPRQPKVGWSDPSDAAVKRWRDLTSRLATDPDAMIEEL
jgi:hypothetical protein